MSVTALVTAFEAPVVAAFQVSMVATFEAPVMQRQLVVHGQLMMDGHLVVHGDFVVHGNRHRHRDGHSVTVVHVHDCRPVSVSVSMASSMSVTVSMAVSLAATMVSASHAVKGLLDDVPQAAVLFNGAGQLVEVVRIAAIKVADDMGRPSPARDG